MKKPPTTSAAGPVCVGFHTENRAADLGSEFPLPTRSSAHSSETLANGMKLTISELALPARCRRGAADLSIPANPRGDWCGRGPCLTTTRSE